MYNKVVYYIFLMFMSPALTLYVSFKENNLFIKKWVLILLITVFGSIILFTPAGDGVRYVEIVENHYIGMSFAEFSEGLINIFKLTPEFYQRGDPYVHIVSYISGGIFQSEKPFFIIISFIYGYFYISSLLKVFYKFKIQEFTLPIVLLGMVLIFWEGVEGINTVRTWTGAWVLFYSVISYFEKKQVKYLILIALCPLIHFAYFFISIPVWIVILFNVKPMFYTILYVTSFLFTFNTAGNFVEVIKNTSELGEGRVQAYDKGEEYYEEQSKLHKSTTTWYAAFGSPSRFIALNILIFILVIQGNFIKMMTGLERKLFSVALLMMVIANYSSAIPAMKTRTMRNAGIYVLAVTIMILIDKRFYLKKAIKPFVDIALLIIMGLFCIFLLYKFASLLYLLSVFIFLSPLIPWIFNDMNFSIRDIFK